jgi:hypothetical protein
LKKRYIVVLDSDSAAARMLDSAREVDLNIKAGDTTCPALLCTRVETDNPAGIWVTRVPPASAEVKTTTLFFPTGTVVGIMEYDEDQPVPIGFVPRK